MVAESLSEHSFVLGQKIGMTGKKVKCVIWRMLYKNVAKPIEDLKCQR